MSASVRNSSVSWTSAVVDALARAREQDAAQRDAADHRGEEQQHEVGGQDPNAGATEQVAHQSSPSSSSSPPPSSSSSGGGGAGAGWGAGSGGRRRRRGRRWAGRPRARGRRGRRGGRGSRGRGRCLRRGRRRRARGWRIGSRRRAAASAPLRPGTCTALGAAPPLRTPPLGAVAALGSLRLTALVRGADLDRRDLGSLLGSQQDCHGGHRRRAGGERSDETGGQRPSRAGSPARLVHETVLMLMLACAAHGATMRRSGEDCIERPVRELTCARVDSNR